MSESRLTYHCTQTDRETDIHFDKKFLCLFTVPFPSTVQQWQRCSQAFFLEMTPSELHKISRLHNGGLDTLFAQTGLFPVQVFIIVLSLSSAASSASAAALPAARAGNMTVDTSPCKPALCYNAERQ